QAERLSREKDEMVAMVSHDLKTPLHVLALSFDFFQRHHPSKDAAVQRMMERALRAVKMMEGLVVNILDVVKLEAGTLDLNVRPVNAIDLVTEATELSMPVAQEKQVRLVMNVLADPGLNGKDCMVCAEPLRLNQVLGNLIGNALKFTPAGGSITVSLQPREKDVLFSVADTGEGMSAESLRHIFKRFWQVEETRGQGSG